MVKLSEMTAVVVQRLNGLCLYSIYYIIHNNIRSFDDAMVVEVN